ncbi:MAG: hypothetical protein LDL38_11595 [Flavobacterium piscis]|nr:hypothetical protein [Flavobacterium piscis]
MVLIFVLFAGGFGTKYSNLKPVIKPTLILATIGVLLTAHIAAIIFSYVSVVWPPTVRTKLVKVRQKYYFLHQFCMRFESKNLQEGQRSILVSVL